MSYIRKNSKLGNWLHYNHPEAQAVSAGKEPVLVGYMQIQVGEEEDGTPILGDGSPIYEDGDDLFEIVGWQEVWGEPPSDQDLAEWEDPTTPPEPNLLAEGVATYRSANAAAQEVIFLLMTQVAGILIAFELFTESNVNDEGTDFVTFHALPILNYKTSGRNAKAAQALYDAIKGAPSRSAFPWLEVNGEYILGVFAAGLGATP